MTEKTLQGGQDSGRENLVRQQLARIPERSRQQLGVSGTTATERLIGADRDERADEGEGALIELRVTLMGRKALLAFREVALKLLHHSHFEGSEDGILALEVAVESADRIPELASETCDGEGLIAFLRHESHRGIEDPFDRFLTARLTTRSLGFHTAFHDEEVTGIP
ncbi:MAG: hypothetical protein R3B99_34910 [Polyangiales bacterium]